MQDQNKGQENNYDEEYAEDEFDAEPSPTK